MARHNFVENTRQVDKGLINHFGKVSPSYTYTLRLHVSLSPMKVAVALLKSLITLHQPGQCFSKVVLTSKCYVPLHQLPMPAHTLPCHSYCINAEDNLHHSDSISECLTHQTLLGEGPSPPPPKGGLSSNTLPTNNSS